VCGFLRRNKFSIKPRWVFGTAGSTTKRRVPHPLRSLQRVGYATVGIEIRGIPPFAKNAKDGAPRDLLQVLPRTRNAPFHTPRAGNAGGRLRRNNSSIKQRWVLGTAGSTTKRRVADPLRSLQRVGYATVGIEIRGIPPFAKNAKDGAPGDLLRVRPGNIEPLRNTYSIRAREAGS
jgi:hypothetical protein